jgi:di/tricarboxylate transporter
MEKEDTLMRWSDAIGAFGWGLLVIGVLICFSTAGNRSELFAWIVGGAMWIAGFLTPESCAPYLQLASTPLRQ